MTQKKTSSSECKFDQRAIEAFEAWLETEPEPSTTFVEQAAAALEGYNLKASDLRDSDLEWLFDRIEGYYRPKSAYLVEGDDNQRHLRNALIEDNAEGLARRIKTSALSAARSKSRGDATRENVQRQYREIKAREPDITHQSVI